MGCKGNLKVRMDMTNSITISHFDFSDVPDQNKAIELDIRFDYAKQKAESGLIEMGQALAEQKTVLPHGCWIKWLESKDISANTAQRLIQISEKFSNTAHGPHLGFGIMRLLAQDTVPESARQEALEKSEAGEKLSIKSTKELIEAHKRIDDLETEPYQHKHPALKTPQIASDGAYPVNAVNFRRALSRSRATPETQCHKLIVEFKSDVRFTYF